MIIDEQYGLGFPLSFSSTGELYATGGDEAIRGKIIQILFTAPGERVDLPEFGCGLFNLVFEPNNVVLAAAMEFTISQALTRWLRNDIILEQVHVDAQDEQSVVEIVYSRRSDLSRQMVRVHYR